MAIQAAARADAEVKGASRDRVFALERLVTVIATRAPYALLSGAQRRIEGQSLTRTTTKARPRRDGLS